MVSTKRDSCRQFIVKFWGTRGTRTVSNPGFSRYGCDTICVEVNCGNRTLVFDAGSGFIGLGKHLQADKIKKIDLFLTHAHYDHVEGIPFFDPFYDSNFEAAVWSGRLKGIEFTREIIDGLMREPYFPIRLEKFHAKLSYKQISDGESLELGDGITIHTTRLHHPGGATGYRIEYDNKSFAFITDTTHPQGQRDLEISRFLKNVDLFAYDCSYLDSEFEKYASFGHSTWEEAIRLKTVSGAKKLLGLHHMPFRSDEDLDNIRQKIVFPAQGCDIAEDQMAISL